MKQIKEELKIKNNKEKIIVCTYDNPATMCRECWQNGKLLYSYSIQLFLDLNAALRRTGLPIFFGANVGCWESGRLVGDKEAISLKMLQMLEKYNVPMFSECN